MTEERVRWGVISTANIGRRAVLPAIQRSRNGELVAVGSRDAGKAAALAGELAIPRAYGSYEELLADPAVEAVYIPLPNNMHCEWTIRAAQAGKHVLCEKPLALDATECAAMEAAARGRGGSLMDVGCYCVNVARTLFDAEPIEVQAYAVWAPSGVDEQVIASVRFAGRRWTQFDCALTLVR